MKKSIAKIDRNGMHRAIAVLIGVAVNVLLSYAMGRIGLPIYLDTIGTISVSALCGLFPGIITAMVTNMVCTVYNPDALYFSLISVLIAIFTAWISRRRPGRSVKTIIMLIAGIALIAGGISTFIQWGLFGGPQSAEVADTVEALRHSTGLPVNLLFLLVNMALNLIDKGISVGIALLIMHYIPEKRKNTLLNGGWRQRPLTDEEIRSMKSWSSDIRRSVKTRMTMTLLGVACAIALVIVWIGLRLYFESLKAEKTDTAMNAVKFAASVIDPDKVDEYMKNGEAVEGYKETRDILYQIRDTAMGVEYLYAVKVKEDACYAVFDLETEDVEAYEPGEKIEFEEAFLPYLPALFAGEEIEPIESDDTSGWVQTVYYPVRNKYGNTVCYAGADVSLSYVASYMTRFVIKVLLILAGFFILILAYGLWTTGIFTVYPINSIAECVDSFVTSEDSQDVFDENVRKLRSLEIHTGDEVEKLYRSICRMALDQAEQMRDIRHYADASSKMQSGLIITMADMVENRDSDTGAHVQKTSAYAKIIAEGLRNKGYYAEKITPEFINAVVMSAPLHDVGKICIPDGILNKPGKLTDDEYAIMKTHTVEGKKIMEKAINTVKGENYLKEARNMAGYHHERWDGKGYPEGLHGEVIPLSARIMAVADVFDALASPRVYKPAFPLDKALSIIQEGAGTQFDPRCVEVFMEALPEVKIILKKYHEA